MKTTIAESGVTHANQAKFVEPILSIQTSPYTMNTRWRRLSWAWPLGLIGMVAVASAQQPSFLWAKRAGGPATTDVSISDLPGGICVGANGRITVVGQFYQTATFGNRMLTARGMNSGEPGWEDAFFVQYDAAGTVLWAQRAGGASRDAAFAVCADRDGNVYATGEFGMIAQFGTQILFTPPSTPYGNSDAFLAKLDPNGTFLWTRQIGTAKQDGGYAVAMDPEGNCLVGGSYDRDDFGNGVTFVAKYNSSGERLWFQQFGGSRDSRAFALAVSPVGDIFVAGYFTEMATFGTNSVTSAGAQDGFLAKLDSGGNSIWVKSIGGSATDWASGVAISADGSAYVTGHGNAGSAQFVSKYSASGTLLWPREDGGGAVAVDAGGYAYVSAYTAQTHAVFMPPFYSAPNLISIYSPAGMLVGTVNASGTQTDYVYSAALDSSGNLNVLGFFNGTATFGGTTLRSQGDDMFIAHLDSGKPTLGYALSNGKLVLTWPTNVLGFGLQSAAVLDSSGQWGVFDGITETSGTNYQVAIPLESPQRYFRLSKP